MNFSKYTYDSSRSDHINHLRNPASKTNIHGPHLGRALREITAAFLLLLIPLSLAHSNSVLNGPVRFYNYGESYPIRLLLIESNGAEVKNGYNFQIDPENSVTREVNLYDKFRIFRVNRGTGSGEDIDLSLSSSEAYITRTLTIDTLSPAQGEYRIFTSGTFGEDADVRSNPDHAAASIVSAYYGYDVREHNPLDFSAARRSLVFEGLSNANTAWDTVETALPVGCSYLTRNSGELKTSSTKEHFTQESYHESWGFNVGGTFPLPKPGLSASASLGVNHTESEQTSTREVFISKHYLKEAYIGHCNPYNPKEDGELRKFGKPFPNLHSAFNNDIINLDPNSESDADRFINEYGTHYPGAILYGGFSSFVLTLSEENYEKAKRLGVDFSAAINNAGSAGTPVEENLTHKDGNVEYSKKTLTTEGKKPPSTGEVGFHYGRDENFQETLNQSSSRWISIGTEPGTSFDNVVSTNESAVPIQMDWARLDKLIHVDLVDSNLTINELNARKDAISAAIDRAISEATQRALQSFTKPEKGYKFRITGIDVSVIRDETDPGLSGEINICNDLSQCITVWDSCDHPDMHIGAIHKQCWLNNHIWAKDWKTEWQELVIEGKTDIDNNGAPQVTYEEPGFSSIFVSGELVDFDIGGPETNDIANFTSRYQIDQLNDIETIEIAAPFFNEGKEIVANAKITLEIMPLPLPGNQPETFDDFSNSSPPLRTAFIGESAQDRYLPPPSPTDASTNSPVGSSICSPPTDISPSDGSYITSGSQLISWKKTACDYHIFSGTSTGNRDFDDSGNLGSVGSYTIKGHAQNDPVVVTLYYRTSGSGKWSYKVINYKVQSSSICSPPADISPSDGSYITSDTQLISWKNTGCDYHIFSGKSTGNRHFDDSGNLGSVGSYTIKGHTQNDPVVVTLYYRPTGSGNWSHKVINYKVKSSSTCSPPADISPSDGSYITSGSQFISWKKTACDYHIYSGMSSGNRHFDDSGNLGSVGSYTIKGHTQNHPVVVTLYYRPSGSGNWNHKIINYKVQ